MTHPETARARPKDLARAIIVLAAFAVTIGMVLFGSGALGGTPTSEAAGGALSATATELAPATGAFSIWSVIYIGLGALVVWQLLPRQRSSERHRAVGGLLVPALVLNGLWLVVVQFDLLGLSIIVMSALLASLLALIVILQRTSATSRLDTLITDGTIGLYLGWVSVATAANVAALLAAVGFRPDPAWPWAIAVLVVVAAIGSALALWSRGRIAPSLAMVWGLSWIAVGRLTDEPQSVPTGVTALVAAASIAVTTLVARLRR